MGYELRVDCEPHSSIIISDAEDIVLDPVYDDRHHLINYFSTIREIRRLTDVYINVNSMLTCESFMVDSERIYTIYPFSNIVFKFNDYEIRIFLTEEAVIFSSIIASMYAIWLAFCGYSEQTWLANVLAQQQGSGKPSIEIITATLQGLWSSKQFNLEDFDIKHIPYIKDVYKKCTFEFLDDTIHILDKEQIISIIEELGEEDGERKAMLIRAAGIKDEDSRRFEL